MTSRTRKQGFTAERSKEMAKVLVLTRDLTQQECPWLDHDLPAGTRFWTYEGHTYGCVTPKGVAVTAKLAESPFFEVPLNAVRETSS